MNTIKKERLDPGAWSPPQFKIQRLPIFAMVAGCLASLIQADVGTGGLDQTREFSDSGIDYTITYSDTAGDSDRVSTADVDRLQGFATQSYDRLIDVMGFPSPWLSTLPSYEFIVKDDWWFAEPACVVLDAPSIRAWPANDEQVVFFHEVFHTVQRNYKDQVNGGGSGYIGSTFGKWVSEGTADAMMDKGFAALDDSAGYPFYDGSAANFLNSPDESLFDKEYDCCLWWNYSMEQLGTVNVEPHYGTDFMKAFWNRIVANGDTGSMNSKRTFEQVAAARGRTLESLFRDFTICNYTRDFDVAGIPNANRYFYVDEQTLTIGANVPRTTTGQSGSGTTNVNSWAAKYIEADIDQTERCTVVGFKAESDGDTMAYAVVAIDRDNRVLGIKKGKGSEFVGTFLSNPERPISKLCGILTGLEGASLVDWSFDSGIPNVTIARPTFSRPAYPGTAAEPGNIVVTTKVTGLPGLSPEGPNTPSVLGLEPKYFGVTIGAETATILDAAYVGGQWDLLVAAPVQPSDGLYDITVSLCPETPIGVEDSEKNAVLYGDLKFHHVIVLDVSGSMVFPTDAKLNAAKQAAKFYIDTVAENDKFSVVSFSGNGAECDEDATNLKGSPGLLGGTGFARGLMKLAVDNLNAQNLTSIGDGLWTAQDALDVEASPDAIDTILLLTDGKENESRYWASDPDGCGRLDGRLMAAETIVNTRAFGEDAETDLCQQISGLTNGDYLFTPVDEGGANGARKAITDFNSLQNQLTLRFFAGLEHSKQLQRIDLERSNLGAKEEKEIVLLQPYDKVTSPLIYVGWSKKTKVSVEIATPGGDRLADVSVIYKDDSHIVFHPKNPLKKGEYVVRLREEDGTPVEVFVGISGKPGNKTDFLISLSPIKRGGIFGRQEHPRELYEHGMPVDFNLTALDEKGPMRDLEVTLEVLMPNGKQACPIPFDMVDNGSGVDGGESDGRYGFHYTRTPFAASYTIRMTNRTEKDQAKRGESGTYIATIRVRGKDNFGNLVERSFERSFQVYRRGEFGNGDGDTDNDGMPDSWEVYYGTDPQGDDAADDQDSDGLMNIEEFQMGTRPRDPDTDNGGAADGYEVKNGLCPLNRRDDPFPNLAPVAVITTSDAHGDSRNLKPDALLLHFPDDPAYGKMEIFRSTASGFDADASTLIKILDMDGLVNSVHDEGLNDGKRYFYKFRALSVDGEVATPISRQVSGIARSKPAEPHGSIVINSGQGKTDRKEVAVKILPRGNSEEYRLSNTPFGGGEPWTPVSAFGEAVPFDIEISGLNEGDHASIYFEFRSGAGIVSRTYYSAIALALKEDHDGTDGDNSTDNDDDNDGISDKEEIFKFCTNPFSKDSDGDGYSDKEEIDVGTDPNDFDSLPDSDGDGFSDKLEDKFGSDAGNSNSTPDIGLEISNTTENTEVSSETLPGVIYRVHSRGDLTVRVRDWPVVAGPFVGDGKAKVISLPRVDDKKFYAVSFELESVN